MHMINFCMRGCSKAVGLAALSFCAGMLAGLFLPLAAVAVIELIFAYRIRVSLPFQMVGKDRILRRYAP